MKKKNGFTLVELLAVIVILAVVALIATPIIIKAIEKSKKSSVELSLEAISTAADLYKINHLKNENIDGTIIDVKTLKFKGKVDSGSVIYNKNGKNSIIIFVDNYCAYKYAGAKKGQVGDVKEGICYINDQAIELNDIIISEGVKENTSATISNGEISITKNDKTTVYKIESNGNITKNNTLLNDSEEINNAYIDVVDSVLKDIDATEVLISQSDILAGIQKNEAALESIANKFVDYFNAKFASDDINNDLTDIQSKIDLLNGGNTSIQQGNDVKESLTSYITKLNNIVNNSGILIENMGKLLNNTNFLQTICKNSKLRNIVFNDEKAVNSITKNVETFNKISSDATVFTAFLDSQVARLAMYNNYKYTESALAKNTTAINIMKQHSRYTSTATKDLNDQTRVTIYNGKAFVISTSAYSNSGYSIYLIAGNFINGSKEITFRGTSAKTTNHTVNKFASTVIGARYGGYSPYAITTYYFKI